MKENRISPAEALFAWLILGFRVGQNAGVAFCLMLPLGLRVPFRLFAESYEAAKRAGASQATNTLDQIGFIVFQAITYLGVVPAEFIGRFVVGPIVGIFTMLPFCIPAFLGMMRRDAPKVDHFNWFTAQANKYGPVSVWGAIATSALLSVLMLTGYLPNIPITLPWLNSSWTTLGLAWAAPFCCSFMALSFMGCKQWVMFAKHVITHQGEISFPLTGTIQTLKLTEQQQNILLGVFQHEHQTFIGDKVLYGAVTMANYDSALLLQQKHFAESLQNSDQNTFNEKIENRKIGYRK
jgi:hypothetical protein